MVRLWHLYRLLLHASLSDLAVIVILHLILLDHLVSLVPLRRLLLQPLVLDVCVLDDNLFVLLLDDLLVLDGWLLSGSLHALLETGHRARVALLLLGNPLLLFGRALVAVFVAVFGVEEAFERLNELGLLVLDVFLVGVARKVDVLALTGLLDSRVGSPLAVIVTRVKWLLLFELVEARAVFHVFDLRNERRLRLSYVVPVDAFEERVVLDLVDPTSPEPVVYVAEKPFQDVSCLWR